MFSDEELEKIIHDVTGDFPANVYTKLARAIETKARESQRAALSTPPPDYELREKITAISYELVYPSSSWTSFIKTGSEKDIAEWRRIGANLLPLIAELRAGDQQMANSIIAEHQAEISRLTRELAESRKSETRPSDLEILHMQPGHLAPFIYKRPPGGREGTK